LAFKHMLSSDRRDEIATFLKSRRTRRQPEEVGLPRGGRRRTPGLRREEVATLAQVSIEWYTWLEQARDINPSADALRRIASALKLEPGETQHLLNLAGYGVSGSAGSHRPVGVSPRLQRLIDQLEFCPAWVYGDRWDFLAWNRAASVIHGDLNAMAGIERNSLYQIFVGTRMRGMLVDWERHAKNCVAKIRAGYARNVDDPWFNELLELLRTRSPEFARWWNDHEVQLSQEGMKTYVHPEAGPLTFDFTVLDVTDEQFSAAKLVSYVPAAGTGTREKMEELLSAVVV
jgi:transcriptional regulator with XRE-family HTH domain